MIFSELRCITFCFISAFVCHIFCFSIECWVWTNTSHNWSKM